MINQNKINNEVKNMLSLNQIINGSKIDIISTWANTFKNNYLINEFDEDNIFELKINQDKNVNLYVNENNELDLYVFSCLFIEEMEDQKEEREIKFNAFIKSFFDILYLEENLAFYKVDDFISKNNIFNFTINLCFIEDKIDLSSDKKVIYYKEELYRYINNYFNNEVSVSININFAQDLINKLLVYSQNEGVLGTTELKLLKANEGNRGIALSFSQSDQSNLKTYLTVLDSNWLKNVYKSLEKRSELNSLFSLNVREYFKDKKVDSKIADTLKKEPNNFFAYNNGLTIVGDNINIKDNLLFIENMCIINGAQTTNILCNSDVELEGVGIFAKIIDVSGIKDNERKQEIVANISQASNNQKPVKIHDLITQNDIIKKFVKKFNIEADNISRCCKKIAQKKSTLSKKVYIPLEEFIKIVICDLLLKPGSSKSGFNNFIITDQQNDLRIIKYIFENFSKNNNIKNTTMFFNDVFVIKELTKKAIGSVKKQLIEDYTKKNNQIRENDIKDIQRDILQSELEKYTPRIQFLNTCKLFIESLIVVSLITKNKNEDFITEMINNYKDDIKLVNYMFNNQLVKSFLREDKSDLKIVTNEVIKEFIIDSVVFLTEKVLDKLEAGKAISNIAKQDKHYIGLLYQALIYDQKILGEIEKLRNLIGND